MRTVVGLLTLRLAVHAAASLKDKRSVSRRLQARLRQRFNVAVAETEDLDSWTRLTLGVACVSNSERHAQAMLERVARAVEAMRIDADLVDYELELL